MIQITVFIRNYISFSNNFLSAISKFRREDISKPTVGNVSLHRDSNDNGVRIVNFATSNNLVVKSKMFPQQNILKYTWSSPDGKIHNQIDHILIDRR